MKINNFSAGPSKIPQTVLDQLGKDIIGYKDLGYSVLELSHRSQEFDEILQDTKKNLINILNLLLMKMPHSSITTYQQM